jgi:hypothetical protein
MSVCAGFLYVEKFTFISLRYVVRSKNVIGLRKSLPIANLMSVYLILLRYNLFFSSFDLKL